ncbi:c-type cytochrome [Stieleria sp. ICT_E10.1]|uniref:c-type cytochrome n=1 Tax=Stieleria sedimenti TaxID=2976331 RepID=UPI00217F9290|nr:c-type cytochrome [Stieleria sedimenti]MCS7469283.1 c-type cytochrome [Stieleria sedimenti]
MKDFLKKLALLGLVLAVIGLLVLVSGIVPVKASSGHWPITRWILGFASDRSVAFHSNGTEVPPLDDPGMLTLGAGIYQSNCKWCHGRPGLPSPPVPAAMTPAPPYLPDVLHELEPSEMFYIVKHGIKFTGMPAWPTRQRDDEIWPLVAFLKQFSEMSVAEYQDLVHVEENADAPEIVTEACTVCHAADGMGRGNARVPILAGQNEVYLQESLQAFAEGDRHSGVMEPISARLSQPEIVAAAKWYAGQELTPTDRSDLDDEAIRAGRDLISQQDDTLKVAACSECHGEWNDPSYPVLAGQPAEFLNRQLTLFRKRSRGGAGNGNLMHKIADAIDEEQSQQIASYFASLARNPTGEDE